MKPHWSENAKWQFLGVVLSALGLLISLLPENQRLLGFIVSMGGMGVLSWVLLRKPVKRITQQLTPRNVPRTSLKSPVRASQFTISKQPLRAKEENKDYQKKFVRSEKWQTAFIVFLSVSSVALAFWEFLLIQNHLYSISSVSYFISLNESPDYIKLAHAYNELFNYIEQLSLLIVFGLTMINGYIAYFILTIITFVLRKLRQYLP